MKIRRLLLAALFLFVNVFVLWAEDSDTRTLIYYFPAPYGAYPVLSAENFIVTNLYLDRQADRVFWFDMATTTGHERFCISSGSGFDANDGASVMLYPWEYPSADNTIPGDMFLTAGRGASGPSSAGDIRLRTGLNANMDRLTIDPYGRAQITSSAKLHVKGNNNFTRINGQLYIADDTAARDYPHKEAVLEVAGSGGVHFPKSARNSIIRWNNTFAGEPLNPLAPESLITYLFNPGGDQHYIFKSKYNVPGPATPTWKPLLSRFELRTIEGSVASGATRSDTGISFMRVPNPPAVMLRGLSSRPGNNKSLYLTVQKDLISNSGNWWVHRNGTASSAITISYTLWTPYSTE